MHLESVQIGHVRTAGTPAALDPFEQPWTSGIWKLPVGGPVEVTMEGLVGDQIADRTSHGGPDQAVLIYSADHYPKWQAEWGTRAVEPGSFGENLTISRVSELIACIGDVLEIGDVRLEVSCPRGPCHKLARRHGRKDLVDVVRRNHRHGWYARVQRPGTLAAGMPVRLVDRPYPQWPIARVAHLRWFGEPRSPELEHLQLCPALAVSWCSAIRRKASAA